MRGSVPRITKESKADIDSWGDDMMPKTQRAPAMTI